MRVNSDFLLYLFLYFAVMNDPIEHATGLEKKELLAKLAGNDDPYHMKAITRGPSTKENPTMVPSAFDARIVGCVCKYSSNSFGFSFSVMELLYFLIISDPF